MARSADQRGGAGGAGSETTQPHAEPPDVASTGASVGSAGSSQPEMSTESLHEAAAEGAAQMSAPSAMPPARLAAGGGGITAMQSDKRVTALWVINEVRNAWAHFDGIGWRKLANNSDSAIVALNLLMNHARQTNARVDYEEGSGNIVTQAYVW